MKKIGNKLWGVLLIVLGVIFGGNAIGLFNINIFFDGWWTLFIIIPCFISLFTERNKTGGIIGVLIGVALLLSCQNLLDFELILKLAFPTILIIIGLSIVFKDTINGKVNDEIKKLNSKGNLEEHCATFSSQNLNFENEEFKGTTLTAVFGGLKCDLRNAIINSDVVINASAIFGGIDIFVPDNVKVKVKSTAIFGGVSNKTNVKTAENSYTIYVNGTALFGGVEVK